MSFGLFAVWEPPQREGELSVTEGDGDSSSYALSGVSSLRLRPLPSGLFVLGGGLRSIATGVPVQETTRRQQIGSEIFPVGTH
jgi:hypothetical protein